MVMPTSTMAKISAGPSASTSGRTIGSRQNSTTAPMRPPTPDAMADAPTARPPSPRLVIG